MSGQAAEAAEQATRTTEAGGTRRVFLAGSLAVAGAGVLVACAADDGGSGGATGGGSGGGGATAAGGLVALADVPVGGAVSATTSNGDKVLVTQPEAGTVACFSAVCTHQGCAVVPGDGTLACPCHNSVFDLATGENLEGPAPSPLPEVAVEVRDGQVVEA
ncbi:MULTISPECIES: Rieske (2Fe-2S) protein [unclassified Actinotalea]|uniref:Rieske (2Fe-2S) protein n=1 Tax=unclassified Actinotalea TaxID=2638618 RepID=UPI0015F5B861|nr:MULTISPECIES: Rieske (2Fe-2S) protein [unclassified Actinotalea]